MTQIRFKSNVDVSVIQQMGSDAILAAAAWVSTSAEEGLRRAVEKPDDVAGVIRYLMAHRHGTPFEHSAMTFCIRAPIFVWREWHRHRIGFCLSGDTLLDFVVPSTTDRRVRTIKQLYQMWHYSRPNKMPVVRRMRLRCLDLSTNLPADTGIADVFKSGAKSVYVVRTSGGNEVVCSADHKFYTPDGWKPVSDFSRRQSVIVVSRQPSGDSLEMTEPSRPEEWRDCVDYVGYEVSSRGRVRSYYRQGGARLQTTAVLKKITMNNSGRSVVGIEGKAAQVSHLVYRAFNGDIPVGKQILHDNDNPADNHIENLKAGTDQDNKQDAIRNGRLARRRGGEEKVLSVTRAGTEQTYDVEVTHPHHNFLADGAVVHNSYNEESGRYKQLEPVFYLPARDRPMMKVDSWKPGRPKFLTLDEYFLLKTNAELGILIQEGESLERIEERRKQNAARLGDEIYAALCTNLKHSYAVAYEMYEANLKLDIDPGLARDCLPVGIYSSCWVTCNPRSLMHFLSLRTHEPEAEFVSYPLWEIELAARVCEMFLETGWPITAKAFNDKGRVAP